LLDSLIFGEQSPNLWAWFFAIWLGQSSFIYMDHNEGKTKMYDMSNLDKLATLQKNTPEALAAFQALDKAALADGAIPVKYKELMALAVALTTQCPYCLEVHKAAAKKAGATEQELSETVFVATALRAGAALTHGTHLL
jgi:AhpD family alkylhydroperoxidase